MDYDTLHQFVTECLVSEYKSRKYIVVNTKDLGETRCDFRITMPSKRVICCKIVLTEDSFQDVIANNDYTSLLDYCRRENAYPRLILASAWCFATPEGHKMINGSTFTFKINTFSLLDEDDCQEELPMSRESLILKFADAWNRRDVTELSNILDKQVYYSSSFVFDEIRGRKEVISYLGEIFERFNVSNSKSLLTLCRYRETGDLILVDTIKNGTFFFKCNNYKITDVSLKLLDRGQIDYITLPPEDITTTSCMQEDSSLSEEIGSIEPQEVSEVINTDNITSPELEEPKDVLPSVETITDDKNHIVNNARAVSSISSHITITLGGELLNRLINAAYKQNCGLNDFIEGVLMDAVSCAHDNKTVSNLTETTEKMSNKLR